ncbi:CopL family metal-binding regulatory protein [Cognatiluteimonas lumbrici]|jgi:hypothetical protein|uniref:CopL family metal-binding regulatory protein n=1 Tax=Cognatiluteimonas lumbrici TaxID=2559601 RepID=UPI00112DC725
MLSPLVLFRLLLSVALVLNGIGGAMAATRMHVEQASTAEQVRMPASAGIPCHDEQGAAEGDAGAPHEESPAPDCCKSGLCACACAHVSQVPLPALPSTELVAGRDLAVAHMSLGHATPALPHLIRPPIR